MTKQAVVAKTAEYVKAKFSGEGTGHDWWHMYRVWRVSKTIAKTEKDADPYIVELGALLHDIADWKFHDGDEEAGPKAAREWLESIDVENSVVAQIEEIIRTVSFKGAGVASNMKTIEGKIVHDADKLDAIGAIGVARAFAYGGANNRPIHEPDSKPTEHTSFEEYKKNGGPTTDHFYEKLLLLKDRLYTKRAKQLADHRHEYMKTFLDEFYDEWDGRK